MSLRRLVHSLLVTGFDGTTPPDWLARRVEEGLGGVCWFAQNVAHEDQTRRLADDLHTLRDDLLVMADEEGGDVTRLEAGTGSSWPGHGTLGALDDVGTTRAVARQLGKQLASAGVDIALSPVVDVNSNPANPVIGVRSFGASPSLVARHGVAFVDGLQASGVAACAKHYPGHGATVVDSHLGLPRVDDPYALVEERDVAPFAAAVHAGVQCVMTAHVVFLAFDDQPATMSAALLGHLREGLGFDGVIISDALDMNAISKGVGRGEGAVRAVAAGVDLVCIGNPLFPERYDAEARLDEIVSAIEAAVHDDRLSIHQLEEAAARVGALTTWLDKHRPIEAEPPDLSVGAVAAARALQVTGDVRLPQPGPVVLDLGGEVNLAAGRQAARIGEALARRDPATSLVTVSGEADAAAALRVASGRAVVVLIRHPERAVPQAVLDAVRTVRPDAVVVATGPGGRGELGDRVVRTFGGGRAVAEGVADLIVGEVAT
jgi:beta-N-acetylhexosaminidase